MDGRPWARSSPLLCPLTSPPNRPNCQPTRDTPLKQFPHDSRRHQFGRGQAILPQGTGPATHREHTDGHSGQEPGLSACRDQSETSWPTVALLAAAAVQIPEQHRRAGPPPHQTAGPARACLWQRANRQTDTGWLRGDGDDQEAPSSQHWGSRHAGAGRFHRQTLRDRRLKSSILSASLVSIERLQQNPARLPMSWATMALPSMRSRRVSSRPLASTSALPAQVG